MYGKLAAIKNIIWAFSIILCLGALAVALVFVSAVRYDGSGKIQDSGSAQAAPPQVTLPSGGSLMTLGETSDGGQAYVDSLTFLCDSALIGLRD